MALNDILTSMDGARDALVTAINAKGGSLADNATLYQCADAVGSLSGDTSAEYYKCTAVSSGASQPEGYTLGLAFDDRIINETVHREITLTMVDASATGLDRVWKSDDDVWYLKKYAVEGSGYISWQLYSTAEDATYCVEYGDWGPNTSTDNDGNIIDNNEPWTITRWYSQSDGYVGDNTWTVSPAISGGSTWSGYKAVFDSTAGTWSFSDTVTEGLSYIGITPVVGKIYSADTTIQVGYIKLDGILNDETVKFLLYPKLNGTLEDVSTGGNGVTVTNTGSVAVENNRIVFGEGKALTIPANTLPDDIFVSGKPFLIEFQGIIPAYTSKTCGAFARKEGSMYYDRLDMYLNTIEGDSNYGQMTIGYWTNNVTVPVGAFTVGAEHVVAFEYDGNNTSRVYLDGVMQYSFTGTDYLPFRTYDFLIGHDVDEIGGSNGNPFQGNMSYFRIRNVAPYLGSNYTPEWV